MADQSIYLTPESVPVCPLDCTTAFEKLTPSEQLYAHHLSRASWAGSQIVLHQTSPESPVIFELLYTLFSRFSVADVRARAIAGEVPAEDFEHLLTYAAQFFANMGNYLGFGDKKFIPRLPQENFDAIIESTEDKQLAQMFDAVKFRMYNLEPQARELDFAPKGTSAYYSEDITKEEVELVNRFMVTISMSPYNTRLWKHADKSYKLLVASAVQKETTTHEYEGVTIKIVYGDYSSILHIVAKELDAAKKYASNEAETKMLEKYVEHFLHGDVNAHKDSQRFWIQDKGPIVETNIGFIESYRDPSGARGEFEGFVAVVNKEMTKKFTALVDSAPALLPLLPWPPAFEKDTFLKPDFTSLDVLTFASSGIPSGINIPNYDDIRQSEGFKNVALGNVISAQVPGEKFSFLSDKDQEPFGRLLAKAFEVQVGLHELLGHGSGKLFYGGEKPNFPSGTLNPITGQPIDKCYKEGETYDVVFQSMASALEECRAECVGIYLCTHPDVLKIFGYEREASDQIYYINWLNMVRAGIVGLEFYSPDTSSWRQAHMRARYAILRVLLEAGNDLVKIDNSSGETVVILDQSKIESVGRPAIGHFLQQLMVLKATADYAGAEKFFGGYTSVSEEHLKLRDEVLARKKPRKVFVQPHTKAEGEKVILETFPATTEGMILSNVAHFKDFLSTA